MTRKFLFFLLLTVLSPPALPQGQALAESALAQRIAERDWDWLRLYMRGTFLMGAEAPDHAFVMGRLVGGGHREMAMELIEEAGVLSRFAQDEYVDLVRQAMSADDIALGQVLLQRYAEQAYAPPTEGLEDVLREAIGVDREFVPLLLDAGVDPNAPYSPLTLALEYTHRRRNWDQSVADYAEEMAFGYGSPKEHAALFWLLVERGADVGLALQRGGLLAAAGITGDKEIFAYLLEHGVADDKEGLGAALVNAAGLGHGFAETLPYLLGLGADPCFEAAGGVTAYDALLYQREVATAKALPELLCAGKVHFAPAAIAGDTELMDYLARNGAPAAEVEAGLLPAVESGSNTAQTIPWLLAHGADICATDANGLTAYERALASSERLDIARNFPQLLCPTAAIRFDFAGLAGDTGIMEFLLANGANIDAADRRGTTALMNALESPQPEAAVRFLLERGADVCKENRNDGTAYELALKLAGTWRTGDVVYRHDPAQLVELLKRNPQLRCPTKDAFDRYFTLSLDTADTGLIGMQLDLGANIDVRGYGGETPLMRVLRERRRPLELARFLVVRGADVCLRADNGETAYDVQRKEIQYGMANFLAFRYEEESAILALLMCGRGEGLAR